MQDLWDRALGEVEVEVDEVELELVVLVVAFPPQFSGFRSSYVILVSPSNDLTTSPCNWMRNRREIRQVACTA